MEHIHQKLRGVGVVGYGQWALLRLFDAAGVLGPDLTFFLFLFFASRIVMCWYLLPRHVRRLLSRPSRTLFLPFHADPQPVLELSCFFFLFSCFSDRSGFSFGIKVVAVVPMFLGVPFSLSYFLTAHLLTRVPFP